MSNSINASELLRTLNDLNSKLGGKNGEEFFRKLKLFLRGEHSLGVNFNALVEEGRYATVSSDLAENRFEPENLVPHGGFLTIVGFEKDLSHDEACLLIKAQGYAHGNIADLLVFGKNNLKLPEWVNKVVALNATPYLQCVVAGIMNDQSGNVHRLSAFAYASPGFIWEKGTQFLVTR